MSLGLVGVVLVVCIGPAHCQIGLIKEHEAAVLRVHGFNLSVFLLNNVEVDAELIHRGSDSSPDVVNLCKLIGNLLTMLALFNSRDLAPQFDEFLLQAHYLDRFVPPRLE